MCAIAIGEFGSGYCYSAEAGKESPECLEEAEALYSCVVERSFSAGECGGNQCVEFLVEYNNCYEEDGNSQ